MYEVNSENEMATKISFRFREIVAGNPFIQGNYIKKCLLIAVFVLSPRKETFLKIQVCFTWS